LTQSKGVGKLFKIRGRDYAFSVYIVAYSMGILKKDGNLILDLGTLRIRDWRWHQKNHGVWTFEAKIADWPYHWQLLVT